MKTCGKFLMLLVSIVLLACSADDTSPLDGITVFTSSTDFAQSQDGWEADFADFPTGIDDSSFYELKYAYTDRPANVGSGKAMMLSGNNHSDDLFMFMKKKITNLAPNTDYTVVFDVELASNAAKGSVGVGGSPGESVYLKAGAVSTEPGRMTEGDNYRLNVDKGNQAGSGQNAILLGDIANTNAPKSTEYAIIRRDNSAANYAPFIVRTNSTGELWLFIGTDSGFEGTTTVYYTKVNVVFSATSR